MALDISTKKVIVTQINTIAKNAVAVGAAQYSGLTVAEMTELRQLAYKGQVSLKVVKNTLAKRAFIDTNCACISDVLNGPLLLGFSEQDPGAVARVFRDFTKENNKLLVMALAVSGELVPADDLNKIADLPTKEQAISMMMALMLAPVEKLAKTLNEVPTKIVRTLNAIIKQKQ